MRLKKESRVIVIDKVNNIIVGIVLRGVKGVEDVLAFNSCNDLINF
jgi:hypothetical protein